MSDPAAALETAPTKDTTMTSLEDGTMNTSTNSSGAGAPPPQPPHVQAGVGGGSGSGEGTTTKVQTRGRKNLVTILCIMAALLVVGLAIVLGITLTKSQDLDDATTSFVGDNGAATATDGAVPNSGGEEVETTSVITDPPTPTPLAEKQKALETLVANLPPYTRLSLHNKHSPQHKAEEWLLQHPDLLEMSESRKLQLFVLGTFYHSMEGPNWSNHFAAQSWLNYTQHECTWHFEPVECFIRGHCHNLTQCNDNNEFVAISLQRLRLNDYGSNISLPPEIALLTSLNTISLYYNWIDMSLEDFLPTQLYQMSNLLELNLRTNRFGGQIPTNFGQMTNLHSLSLAGNRLNGTIPTQLGLMKGLTEAYLWRNQLTGKIPTHLGQLSAKMEDFELVGNALTGQIPTQLALMTNIETLHIQQNAFTGEIPTEFGSMPKLRSLSLRQNDLTGTIPAQLASAPLEVLRLEDNALEGTIPQQFGSDALVDKLVRITMHGNNLGGTVPPGMCKLGAYDAFQKTGLSFDCLTDDPEEADSFLGEDDDQAAAGSGICGCDSWCPCWVVGTAANQDDNNAVGYVPASPPGNAGNNEDAATEALDQQLDLLKDP